MKFFGSLQPFGNHLHLLSLRIINLFHCPLQRALDVSDLCACSFDFFCETSSVTHGAASSPKSVSASVIVFAIAHRPRHA